MAEIEIQNVTKTFSGSKQPAVNDVSLRVRDGEFMVLLGPSGCGKTTLLRMLAGLDFPDSGQIVIGGNDVTALPPRQRQIAMVFQSYAIFPHLTVFENIAFGLRMRREPNDAVKPKVERAAAMLNLEAFLGRYPAQLSGGQRQRVAVARAIVMEPKVLLMDEPLSNLDALLRLNFRAELKKLVQELGATTIYVTHDQVEALSLGNRIAVMRTGEIVQCAAPMQVYDRPATEFVGSFIGNPPMNFLYGQLEWRGGAMRLVFGDHGLNLPGTYPIPDRRMVLVGVRAENIEALAEPTPQALPARAEVVEPLGSHLLITATLGQQSVKIVAKTDFPAFPAQPIWLRPEVDKLRWFDTETRREISSV
ncbi:MAG: ABC transporter ATP-binding protein [Chloroflexaceae bacterium]|jgi:multiple sugar transport system ATP-binding protein|nr:ABC transporter ATP-binding protein [Chloroflexaceae bacterium]